jgi:hypothetical protein
MAFTIVDTSGNTLRFDDFDIKRLGSTCPERIPMKHEEGEDRVV